MGGRDYVVPPAASEVIAARLLLTSSGNDAYGFLLTLDAALECGDRAAAVIGVLAHSLVRTLDEHDPEWVDETAERLLALLDWVEPRPLPDG